MEIPDLGMSEDDKIDLMNSLIARWRLPGLMRIRPRDVIPDTTNRENTGLSPVHVHYIACQMEANGFQPRGSGPNGGHELPILIAENSRSRYGAESCSKWGVSVAEHAELPRVPAMLALGEAARTQALAQASAAGQSPGSLLFLDDEDEQPPFADGRGEFYTSLGNGHFFQALNLIGTRHACMFKVTGATEAPERRYTSGEDARLRSAIEDGVECLVLRNEISEKERKFVSKMLNSAFEYLRQENTPSFCRPSLKKPTRTIAAEKRVFVTPLPCL